MEVYRKWVRRNRDYVHSFESLANGLTWLLPERFSDSEIGPEAVTSILGILTTINGHILETPPTQPRFGDEVSSPFPASLCITLLKDVETLVEVAAQQLYGEETKWNFLAVTEAAKVLLRLVALQSSGYKMLLHGGENINDGTDSDDSHSSRNGSRPHGISDALRNHHPGQVNLEGRALSALSKFGETARNISEPTWLRTVQQQVITDPPSPKPSLLSFLSEKGITRGLFLTGEMMFIVRPLLYVLLIRKYGARSWFPWITSLAVDLFGSGFISYVAFIWRNRNNIHLTQNEKTELKRRKLLWALYLMRDPFFAKYTRQRLDGAQKLLEPVPFIGLLTEKLVELLVGAQTRYTYMSGS